MDPILINRRSLVEWIMAQNPNRVYSYGQNQAIDPIGCPLVQYMKNRYPSITDFRCGLIVVLSNGGTLARLVGFNITDVIPVELRKQVTYRALQQHLKTSKLALV